MSKIEKSCDNCIHKSPQMLCKPYCVDFSSHEFTCEFCAYLTPNESRFCESDHSDDGMSCCGDNFKLNSIYE